MGSARHSNQRDSHTSHSQTQMEPLGNKGEGHCCGHHDSYKRISVTDDRDRGIGTEDAHEFQVMYNHRMEDLLGAC